MRTLHTLALAGLTACGPAAPSNPPIDHSDVPTPSAELVERTFTARPATLDILFVVDTSCSMAEELDKLDVAFDLTGSSLLTRADDVHVGVITTQVGVAERDGRLVQVDGARYLASDTPAPATVFGQMIRPPDVAGGTEDGFLALERALAPGTPIATHNQGFQRPGTSLHALLISDSTEPLVGDVDHAIAVIEAQRSGGGDATLSLWSPLGAPSCASGAPPSGGAVDVAQATGGVLGSICSDAWAGLMVDFIDHVAPSVSTLYLDTVPALDTLQVEVLDGDYLYGGQLDDGASEPCDDLRYAGCFAYHYLPEANAIAFDLFRPSPGAEITVRYQRADAP